MQNYKLHNFLKINKSKTKFNLKMKYVKISYLFGLGNLFEELNAKNAELNNMKTYSDSISE